MGPLIRIRLEESLHCFSKLGGPRIGSWDPSFRMKNASSTSSIHWGLQFCGNTQRCCYVYSLRRNQDPAPRLHYCLWTLPPWPLQCLPSLIGNLLSMLFGTQGMSRRLKSIPLKAKKKKNRGYRKALCSQEPHGAPPSFNLTI